MKLIKLSSLLWCTLFAALLSINTVSYAQKKVVVIPLQGDDVIVEVPAPLTPTTPIANIDTDQSDYTIGALTAVDNITGLEWQRMDDDVTRAWGDALDYCVNLNLDIHDDWRLPTVIELLSITDYGRATSPLIDPVAFINPSSSIYWSATNSASNSSRAWGVVGGFSGDLNKTNLRHARCVR